MFGSVPVSNIHNRQLVCGAERGTNMKSLRVVFRLKDRQYRQDPCLWARSTQDVEDDIDDSECSAVNTDHCALCWAQQINKTASTAGRWEGNQHHSRITVEPLNSDKTVKPECDKVPICNVLMFLFKKPILYCLSGGWVKWARSALWSEERFVSKKASLIGELNLQSSLFKTKLLANNEQSKAKYWTIQIDITEQVQFLTCLL